ncbi:hypothetical protein HBI56_041200 [Parastagonospora nodorum]|uniref:SWIM-type domain-containing protein n=2 Tax=Phaeosphaeria nodorum (strain SN15 / ATCC MYA-4574 / FGSC 10173) TaxID=321614 RepID=A0A7U2EUY2_PHANO|nr:hypothetical protein SNOG_03523 [Parastagonospora nodorum SN15]KAH3915845.1 hypothetical protein HBH56_065560 [Parastagonospora nodorum]EAT88728.1 hypothetical protein SNOG_03523 [Parastagonospora nodorum SN15]KAH3932207.1 hypothetical protein HBH54_082530 [Parastagonospora nodorum]KAH3954870.1 hypothetical protein HBH53_011860 [Parastagonospora nodorum]KAH3986121.1 hypothetical protein HBH52_043060 [Parastagonospora nodorum]
MSAEQFSKLSLREEMVTTRAGAAKAARPGSGSSSDTSHDKPLPSIESPAQNSSVPALVISTNNLQYNVSNFDSDLRQRVKNGLEENEIKMKYCALSTGQETNGKKQFYIDDDITVSIGGELRRPTCTCGANEKGLACKHIYWLVDQILSTAPEYLDEKPVQFSPDGSTVQSTTPVDILNNKGLEGVAGDLKWVLQKEDLPEDEDDMRDEITNMLSVFEPQEALPGEFKTPESPLISERSRRYQEFAALFSEYAIRDPGLFLQVRHVIDPDFQRRVFFQKINSRIARTFHALDEYITHGSVDASPDALRLDIPNCAGQLKYLVNAIDKFCCEQDADDSDTRNIAVRAAAALITILDEVVKRNVNSYEQNPLGLEAPSDPVDNNLFVALIGSHKDGSPMFVLDSLRSLPQEDVLQSHWEVLQRIEQKLADAQTPSSYENTFRRFVHDTRKRASSEVREGEPKRTMQE